MLTIRELSEHPDYRRVTYTTRSEWDFSFNVPIVSCGYRERFPSCTAIGTLNKNGLAGLAHINPYDNGVSIGSSMYREYLERGDSEEDISSQMIQTTV